MPRVVVVNFLRQLNRGYFQWVLPGKAGRANFPRVTTGHAVHENVFVDLLIQHAGGDLSAANPLKRPVRGYTREGCGYDGAHAFLLVDADSPKTGCDFLAGADILDFNQALKTADLRFWYHIIKNAKMVAP
jgi:hypothetical protein